MPLADDADFQLLLRMRMAENRWAMHHMQRVLDDQDAEESRRQLKRLANLYPDDEPHALTAIEYYAGMQSAIEEDHALDLFLPAGKSASMSERRERFKLYQRYRELFVLEIRLARRQKRTAIALSGDWSSLPAYLSESAELGRNRIMLWAAGLLYLSGVPGALDVCHRAAAGMFRNTYRLSQA